MFGIKYNGNKSIVGMEDSVHPLNLDKLGRQTYNPQELMELTFEEIDTCDLVVIDLTEKGVGLGIEAGYAYSKGIPIITIAKRGSDISEILQGISKEIIFYDSIEELYFQL